MWSASQAGGGLILASPPDNVKKVLQIVMLLDRIEQADTVDEAFSKLDGMDFQG